MNQKGSFSQNILKSIIYIYIYIYIYVYVYWDFFWPWPLSFEDYQSILFSYEQIWLWRTVKIKPKSFIFELKVLKISVLFPCFSFLNLVVFLVFLVYVIICLLSLGLHRFSTLKHVRLQNLIILCFCSVSLFLLFLG